MAIFLNALSSYPQLGFSNRVVNYHRVVVEAEKQYMDKNYREAIKSYKNAFSYYNGFSIDRYNAMLLAEKLNDLSMKKKCMLFFKEHGICNDFFEQFSDMNVEKILKNEESKTNQALTKKIDSIYLIDQSIRLQKGSSEAAIQRVDSVNFIFFKKFVNEEGFPSESLIGIECSNNKKGFMKAKIHTLLKHFCQRKQKDMYKILENALHKGEMNPEEYAYYYSFLGNDIYAIEPLVVLDGEKYIIINNDSLLLKVNGLREKIGLFSVEDHINKILYKLNNPSEKVRMLGFPGIANFSSLPSNVKEDMKSKYKKLIN